LPVRASTTRDDGNHHRVRDLDVGPSSPAPSGCPINLIDLVRIIPYALAMPRSRKVDPVEIATRLAPALRWPGAPDVAERSWRRVALTPEFDAWVIAWPSGGRVDLHDHGSSCGALVVLEGTLVETTPWRHDTGQLSLERHELEQGTTRRLRRGDVHDVTNEASTIALSLHVYQPPLTSMTHYGLADNQLVRRESRGVREWHGSEPAEATEQSRPLQALVQ